MMTRTGCSRSALGSPSNVNTAEMEPTTLAMVSTDRNPVPKLYSCVWHKTVVIVSHEVVMKSEVSIAAVGVSSPTRKLSPLRVMRVRCEFGEFGLSRSDTTGAVAINVFV